MNPYDFVHIDWQKNIERRAAAPHDRFTDGLCGYIEGTITTLTPLFIPQTEDLKQKNALLRSNRPITFARNREGQYVIPGSSLKGLFRSLVETVGSGCWWLYDGSYRDHVNFANMLPTGFKQCSQRDSLCVACRLFGLIKDQILLLGQVGFDDAVCTAIVPDEPMYTPILDNPKPRHKAWYLDRDQQYVAGRKFYFHFTDIVKDNQLRWTRSGDPYNSYIHPLGAGSKFSFSGHFNNVAPDEWPSLLYALTLERDDWEHERNVRHKIGYAKPAGLGSIEIKLTKLTFVDYSQRYSSDHRGITIYEEDALRDYVNNWIQPFLNSNAVTLQDLRRIWGWPPAAGVTYCYPSKREWFEDPANQNAPISATRNAPCQ